MGKNKFIKLIAPLALGVGLLTLGSNVINNNNTRLISTQYNIHTVENSRTTVNAGSRVSISDANLKTALLNLLGKEKTDTLYSDDFLLHEDYKANVNVDPDTGVTVTSAKYRYLNLSNCGITSITELCQFEFPETLKAIDLSHNNITNADLNNITTLINLDNSTTSKITYKESNYSVRSNFSSLILKVNLSYNDINLSECNSSTLENEKLLFGVQQIPHSQYSFIEDTNPKPKYYIKDSDRNYLSYVFTSSLYDKPINYNLNSVEEILTNGYYGKYTVNVRPQSQSATNYFYDNSREYKTYTIRYFSVKIKDDFWVERKSLLNLSDQLIWQGFNDLDDHIPTRYQYSNASTREATDIHKGVKNYTAITFTTPDGTHTVYREFIVKDTIKPILKLNGKTQEYFSQYDENYLDIGATAIDPDPHSESTGDNISHRVSSTSTVKIDILGNYTITYNVTDGYGNYAEPIVRKVSIVKQALSSISVIPQQDKSTVDNLLKFTVKPNNGVNIKDYDNIKYQWYIDGELVDETLGNRVNGQSTYTIKFNKTGKHTLKVILTARQIEDNAEIEKWTRDFTIEVEKNISSNDTIIIAAAIAVLIIIIVITIIAYLKNRKGKNNIHSKKSNKKGKDNNSESKKEEVQIQVIRDYNASNNSSKLDNTDSNNDNNNKPLV